MPCWFCKWLIVVEVFELGDRLDYVISKWGNNKIIYLNLLIVIYTSYAIFMCN